MPLPPAEVFQAEASKEPSDFWLGFAAATFNWGFFAAAYFGIKAVGGVAVVKDLGRFENYASMERASDLFVRRLLGKVIEKPVPVENVAEPRLSCGHDAKDAVPGYKVCKNCRRLDAERQRERRLPDQFAAARAKADALEAEMIRRGIIKCG